MQSINTLQEQKDLVNVLRHRLEQLEDQMNELENDHERVMKRYQEAVSHLKTLRG